MSEKPDPSSPSPAPKRSFQAPKGTRDLYPADLLKKRYIEHCWRAVSLRHGFDEIDGPTFETADLYRVKSGEGILGEMFGVYSGKDPSDIEAVQRGEPPFALRPEFTPTLARMYAARAKQLPQPTKWFCVPNFFRAERPQRGRLREFQQWNVDFLGSTRVASDDLAESGGSPFIDLAEGEVLETIASSLQEFGLRCPDCRIKCSSREFVKTLLSLGGFVGEQEVAVLNLLDQLAKLSESDFHQRAVAIGMSMETSSLIREVLTYEPTIDRTDINRAKAQAQEYFDFLRDRARRIGGARAPQPVHPDQDPVNVLIGHATVLTWTAASHNMSSWLEFDPRIVRGLAYYTGTVFEVIAEGERAVAGGGRYDNLIELFGGPPTPACGFGMGDVVLANLLHDKGLMPEGRELVEALSRPLPMRCDVFVIGASREDDKEQRNIDWAILPLIAHLRHGVESDVYLDSRASDDAAKRMKPWAAARYHAAPLHARRSYKSTRNVGKLLADASGAHARYAAIIERVDDSSALAGVCTLKNLDTGEQVKDVPLTDIAARIK
ncbi:MAG TPA: ATP phosphoribosyltransferase regulatory subunit [Phycisphaerales bacterium]|nr:ATP phosphoribosyltransferase regulatory subunit [Phycisphaerales bacterium]